MYSVDMGESMEDTVAGMTESSNEQRLARAAQLYFLEGWSQEAIARDFAVSRSKVSRMLSEARERGIVEVIVRFPWARDLTLEARLAERYAIHEARVLRADGIPYSELVRGIGYIGAEYLQSHLFEGMVLAFSRGAAMQALSAITSKATSNLPISCIHYSRRIFGLSTRR